MPIAPTAELHEGDRVLHTSYGLSNPDREGVVLRVGTAHDPGAVKIMLDGAWVSIDTRRCFLKLVTS